MEETNSTVETTEQNIDTVTEENTENVTEENTTEQKDSGLLETKLLAGKYKTVKDLVKGHNHQTEGYNKLHAKNKEIEKENAELKKSVEVPEQYKFDLGENPEEEFGMTKKEADIMGETFKEAGLSQKQASILMDKFKEANRDSLPNIEQIKADLGSNAKEILDDCQAHINKFPNIEDREIFNSFCTSAKNVKWLHSMVVSPHIEKPIPGNTLAASPKESAQELRQKASEYYIKNRDKIDSDETMQNKYLGLLQRATALDKK